MVERVQMELLDTLALAHLDLLGMIASIVCLDHVDQYFTTL